MMNPKAHKLLEHCRIKPSQHPVLGSDESFGNNGMFVLRRPRGEQLRMMVSDGSDWEAENLPGVAWEHVSVSFANRTPIWQEMAEVKDMWWEAHECVIQYHPPKSEYVNVHPYTLHLWRPIGIDLPMPPRETIG